MTLVLASTSATRKSLLEAAGLSFTTRPPRLDEAAVRDRLLAEGCTHADLAEALAVAKARDVAGRSAGALVIGADQVLVDDGGILTKPGDRAGLLATLERLQGRRHELRSAIAIARGGDVLWRHTAVASLWMRVLAADDIRRYADRAGDTVFGCVGGYRIEGLGVTLFEAIDGEHTTVLGLPMLPLLAALRRLGVLTP